MPDFWHEYEEVRLEEGDYRGMSIDVLFGGDDREVAPRSRVIPVSRLDLRGKVRRRYDWMVELGGFPQGPAEYVRMRFVTGSVELTQLPLVHPGTVADLDTAVRRGRVGQSGLVLVKNQSTKRLYILTRSNWSKYQAAADKRR